MQNLRDKVQDESKRILKTALPQNRYFTVFLIGLVQSSIFYNEIRDFYKIWLYMCVFMKNIRV